jgi:predicted CXXCH cytochrome family protein
MMGRNRRHIATGLLIALMAVVIAALAFSTASASRSSGPAALPTMPPTPTGANNQVCLSCHSNPAQQMKAANGDVISLYIDPAALKNSVHGANDIACVMCHTNISGYPHPEYKPVDRRQVTLDLYQACKQCHGDNYQKTLDSVHETALASGNRLGAVCTDCHGAHDIRPPGQPRWSIPLMCSKCHDAIFNQYKDSVHGAALLADPNNPDVPTCVDCHGVHQISDPTTAAFRLKSPTEMCGKCHTDAKRMSKYHISTDVLNTYVADFHGTTVTLFEKQSPDQQTNKPVCFDCHGVHNIVSVQDPQAGLEIKSNMLKVCQKCHPDATTQSFTAAWMSHYEPSPTEYPVVYYINLFYKIFIPAVLSVMALMVVLDIVGRVRNRAAGKEA